MLGSLQTADLATSNLYTLRLAEASSPQNYLNVIGTWPTFKQDV